MINKLNKEIEILYIQRHQKEKAQIHLYGIEERLDIKYKELEALDKILEKEERDVTQLEKLSLRGLFFKVLGNKKEQLEKERQEYLISFLKYHECKKRIEAKKFEIKVLREKIMSLDDVDIKLEKAIDQKKTLLKLKNKTASKKIILQEFKVQKIKNKKRELLQAISYGTLVLPEIQKMQNVLTVIDSWSFLSSNQNNALKITPFYDQKKFVKKGKTELGKVNKALDTFVDELHDVSKSYQLDYSKFTSQLTSFLERFYNGLMTDWIFEKKIKAAFIIIEELKDKVLTLIELLKTELEETKIEDTKEQELLESLIIFSEVEK